MCIKYHNPQMTSHVTQRISLNNEMSYKILNNLLSPIICDHIHYYSVLYWLPVTGTYKTCSQLKAFSMAVFSTQITPHPGNWMANSLVFFRTFFQWHILNKAFCHPFLELKIFLLPYPILLTHPMVFSHLPTYSIIYLFINLFSVISSII